MSGKYHKSLSAIFDVLDIDIGLDGYDDPVITGMTADSRELAKGNVFVATKGLTVDARNYVAAVKEAESAALLYEANALTAEQEALIDELKVPAIAIADLDKKLGFIAAAYYEFPSDDLKVFGVTGTNGKTSCAYFMAQCFEGLGFKSGFFGTIGCGSIDKLEQATHTTMDAINLQRSLADMRDQEFTHICMEVSSHSLDQARVAGVDFYGVMLTNLSHDHLDYHGDMQAYAQAKSRLFTDFESKFAVVNQSVIDKLTPKELIASEFVVSYGSGADVDALDIEASNSGISMHIETESLDFHLNTLLIGQINVPNILLVVSCLLALGVDIKDIQAQLLKVQAPAGRMELFEVEGLSPVVVDYAHTPDALKLALKSLREHCEGTLWCVFGCGGDRDTEKRAKMGEIAAKHADKVVVTNDNPRSESPQDIFAQILGGIENQESVMVIESREQAIQWAVNNAEHNDWILVAGKGHEDYQIIGDETKNYSDRVWVAECLEVAA